MKLAQRREGLVVHYLPAVFAAIFAQPRDLNERTGHLYDRDPVDEIIDDAFAIAERMADETIKRFPWKDGGE